MKHYLLLCLLTLVSIAAHAAPSRTADLSLTADSADGTQLLVSWTAPAPASGCSLTSYDVRMSSRSVSNRTWSRATQISGEPAVGTPGSTVNMVITGLTKGTRYYVGLQSTDTCGTSSTSNSAYATTSNQVAPLFKTATLSWTMPTNWIHPASNNNYRLDGVRIHIGTTSGGPYDYGTVDAGFTSMHAITELDTATTFYFVAVAYGFNQDTGEAFESEYSAEVSK